MWRKDGHDSCCGCMICMKLAVAALVIIILKVWDGFANLVQNTNIWWFILALVIFLVCSILCRTRGECCTSEKPAAVKTKKRR